MGKSILIAVTSLFATVAVAQTHPACDVADKGPISYRDAASTDTVRASVRGNPCYKARLLIEVKSQDGKVLYRYAADFKRHTAVDWEDPDLPKVAKDLVARIVKEQEKRTTADLPAWLPRDAYYEKHYEYIKVSRNQYNSLRKEARPIFTHPIHYEEWRAVIFDSATGKNMVILEGGV